MKEIQEILNGLYGSEIEKIDFNFRENTIDILLKTIENGRVKKFRLLFREVLRYKQDQYFADKPWEVISVAEIFHIPEDREWLKNITDEEKKLYNYLIEGDSFELFIKANKFDIEQVL